MSVPGRLPHHAGAPLVEVGVVRLVDGVSIAPYVLPRGCGHMGRKRRTVRDDFSVISGSTQRFSLWDKKNRVRVGDDGSEHDGV